jgi:hypothetical protein
LPENGNLDPEVLLPLRDWFENADSMERKVLHDIILDHIVRKGNPAVANSLVTSPQALPSAIRDVLRDATTEYLRDDSLGSLDFKRSQLDILAVDLACPTPGTATRERDDIAADVPFIEAIAGIYRRKPGNCIHLARSLTSQPVGALPLFESWNKAILTFLKEEEPSQELLEDLRKTFYERSIPESPDRTRAFREIRTAIDTLTGQPRAHRLECDWIDALTEQQCS